MPKFLTGVRDYRITSLVKVVFNDRIDAKGLTPVVKVVHNVGIIVWRVDG